METVLNAKCMKSTSVNSFANYTRTVRRTGRYLMTKEELVAYYRDFFLQSAIYMEKHPDIKQCTCHLTKDQCRTLYYILTEYKAIKEAK